jgi:Zn-finger protein
MYSNDDISKVDPNGYSSDNKVSRLERKMNFFVVKKCFIFRSHWVKIDCSWCGIPYRARSDIRLRAIENQLSSKKYYNCDSENRSLQRLLLSLKSNEDHQQSHFFNVAQLNLLNCLKTAKVVDQNRKFTRWCHLRLSIKNSYETSNGTEVKFNSP